MDDLFSGNVNNPASVTCTLFPRLDLALHYPQIVVAQLEALGEISAASK